MEQPQEPPIPIHGKVTKRTRDSVASFLRKYTGPRSSKEEENTAPALEVDQNLEKLTDDQILLEMKIAEAYQAKSYSMVEPERYRNLWLLWEKRNKKQYQPQIWPTQEAEADKFIKSIENELKEGLSYKPQWKGSKD